jgi:hypothetical protein
MSESDESGNDVDNDEDVIVSRPHYYSIWDCPHINKFTLEENGVVNNGWRCDWCMNPPAIFLTFSATKALAHVLWLPGSDVRPCTGIIPETFMLEYKDLYSRKMEAICSRSNNKNTMTDSIENISRSGQQQVQCRWQALAFAWRLRMQAQVNAVCWCKFSITLSPPSAFLQNDCSHPISLSSEST